MPDCSQPGSSREISAPGGVAAGSGMATGRTCKMKEGVFEDGFRQLHRNEGQHTGKRVPPCQPERET